jgi:hypothetical protein
MKTRYYTAAILMAAAAAGVFAWMLPDLPAKVPVHWNAHGRRGSLRLAVGAFPRGARHDVGHVGVVRRTALAFSPSASAVSDFERTYLNLMLMIEAFLGYIFVITLWAATDGPLDMARAVVGGVAVMLVLVGTCSARCGATSSSASARPGRSRASASGTPPTAWRRAVLVAAALAALAATAAGLPAWIAVTLLAAGLLFPVLYSLLLYKRLEREHALDTAA